MANLDKLEKRLCFFPQGHLRVETRGSQINLHVWVKVSFFCFYSWRKWWRQRRTKTPNSSWNALIRRQRGKLWVSVLWFGFLNQVLFVSFLFDFSLLCCFVLGAGVNTSASSDDSQARTRYKHQHVSGRYETMIYCHQNTRWLKQRKPLASGRGYVFMIYVSLCRDSTKRRANETFANGLPRSHGNDSPGSTAHFSTRRDACG